MKKGIKIALQAVAGIALAAGGLYIFFRKSDDGQEGIFEALVRDISDTSVIAVLVCLGLVVLSTYLRAVRWRLMLPAAGLTMHKRGLFAIIAVSQMLNNILPARLGEVARVALLWKRNNYPIATSIGSLLVEKTLDMMAYMMFLFVPVLILPGIYENLAGIHPVAVMAVWAVGGAFALVLTVFLLYAFRPHWFKAAALRVISRLPQKFGARVRQAGMEAASCLDWIFTARKAACVALLSFAVAQCYAGMILALAPRAAGYWGSLFAQAFAASGAAIPLAPGYVGTLHAVLLQGLVITGMGLGAARATVVLYHALGYVGQTVMGFVFFARMQMKIKDITE